jgi:hypothetical protein
MTSRDNQNDKRTAVENTLRDAGLVQVAGGTRFSYYGAPGQDREGYMIRVGIKAFRIVKRTRIGGKLEDISISKESYHGKADLGILKLQALRFPEWAANRSANSPFRIK